MTMGAKVQSSKSVFLIAMGWMRESSDNLASCVSGLAATIRALEAEGIVVPSPDGDVVLKVQIHVAADLAAIWKLNGVGSASTAQSCLYCGVHKTHRQDIGRPECNLALAENWRTDLQDIFGVPVERTHICVLHTKCRITEKPLKLVAVEAEVRRDAAAKTLAEARTAVAKRRAELRKPTRATPDRENVATGGKRKMAATSDSAAAAACRDAVDKAVAEQAEAEQVLKRLGSAEEYAAALADAIGVSFNFNVKQSTRSSDADTVQCPSLSGPSCGRLWGSRDVVHEPYLLALQGAFGMCEHDVSGATLHTGGEICMLCNTVAIFRVFSRSILPVLEAQTSETLDKIHQAEGMCRFMPEAFDELLKRWGEALVFTFYHGGAANVVSDYIHIVVEHAAELIKLQGPLGAWSQQGFEAAHKGIKCDILYDFNTC